MPLCEQPVEPAFLMCAALTPGTSEMAQASERIERRIGPITSRSPAYPFEFSTYYRDEMGDGLIKQLFLVGDPVDPASLCDVKRKTMEIERELAEEKQGKLCRRANIDPGLITVESLVLATTKYSGHRICIGPGLFAETWLYVNGFLAAHRPQAGMWWHNDYRFEWDADLTGVLKPGANDITIRTNCTHHVGGMFRRPFLYRAVPQPESTDAEQ